MTDTRAAEAEGLGLLLHEPMHWRQWAAIAVCIVLSALDGFDVLSTSFAAPGIAREWGLEPAALGLVLSMELVGMAAGSVVLGQVADRTGRRPMALACLVLMATGMMSTMLVASIPALAATRLATGVGIGGLISVTNAMVTELCNARARGTVIALLAAGFPFGGIVGGMLVIPMLAAEGWRAIFEFGAIATALSIPLVFFLLPETPDFQAGRQGGKALPQTNHSLDRLGHRPIERLPVTRRAVDGVSLGLLFRASWARTTALLTTAYLSHIFAVYFLIKWLSKIVVDMGHSATTGSQTLINVNIGGLVGGLLFSFLLLRIPLRQLLAMTLAASCICFAMAGLGSGSLASLAPAAIAASFFANAAMVGLYAQIATSFPPSMRATGIGFVIGVGRCGAALGPIAGGMLLSANLPLVWVWIVIGSASLFSAIAIILLPSASAKSDSPLIR